MCSICTPCCISSLCGDGYISPSRTNSISKVASHPYVGTDTIHDPDGPLFITGCISSLCGDGYHCVTSADTCGARLHLIPMWGRILQDADELIFEFGCISSLCGDGYGKTSLIYSQHFCCISSLCGDGYFSLICHCCIWREVASHPYVGTDTASTYSATAYWFVASHPYVGTDSPEPGWDRCRSVLHLIPMWGRILPIWSTVLWSMLGCISSLCGDGYH